MAQSPQTLEQLQETFHERYQGRYQSAQIQPLIKSTNITDDLGLKPEGFYEISIRGSKQLVGREAYYQSYAYVEQGIIVILRAYRNDDRQIQGGDPPHFSEMLFQQWVQVTVFQKSTELMPLRQVYIYHVREQQLLDVIQKFQMGEMERRQYTSKMNEFNQISQTSFGKAIGYCLRDHFPQMVIQTIEVRTRKPGIRGLQPPFDVLFLLTEIW